MYVSCYCSFHFVSEGLVGVDDAQVDNLNSASKSDIKSDDQFIGILSYIMKHYCLAIFKGVLVMLLLLFLFGIAFAIMMELLKHQISMQNDVVTNKNSACDCNSNGPGLEEVTVSERVSIVNSYICIEQELINAIYETTNTWYLQLLIKSSINHFQVTPAFLSVQKNLNEFVSTKPFFTFEGGHLMLMTVHLNGYGDDPHVSVFLHLVKGPHDDKLEQSGHLPLKGTFTIELLNPFYNLDHYNKFYLISNDTCSECTKRAMREGEMAKGYGSNFISLNNLHDYYRNDTLYFRISYDTCYSCVSFKHFSLQLLLAFILIYMLDGFCIFVLLVTFDFCRNLIETSKLVFGLNSIDRNSIGQLLIAILARKFIIVGIIVVADFFTIIIWEFTALICYHSANIIRNYIMRILFLSLFYQTVSIFSRKNRGSLVVSPIFMIVILRSFDIPTVVIAIVNIIIMIFNLCFVIMND